MVDARGDERWAPDPHAVWSFRRHDVREDEPIVVVLHHPSDPYTERIDDPNDEDALRAVAHRYLVRAGELPLEPRFRLDDGWVESLADGSANECKNGDTNGRTDDRADGPIAWVALDAQKLACQPIVRSSFASFRVPNPGNVGDSVVLIAAQQARGDFLGSGFGLKVVLHLRRLEGGRSRVAIIGMQALLPAPAARRDLARINVGSFLKQIEELVAPLVYPATLRLRGVQPSATNAVGYDIHGVAVAPAVEVPSAPPIEVSSEVSLAPPARAPAPRVSEAVAIRIAGADGKWTAGVVQRSPLIADAAAVVRDFSRDPTIRPTRTEEQLDHFRVSDSVADPLTGTVDGVSFTVFPCPRFVQADRLLDPASARPALPNGGKPAVRSDDASAIQAFHHVNDLFARMTAYGLAPGAYFLCARPEIAVAYRSGISPGPGKDGQGVNARVLPDGWTSDQAGPLKIGTPKLFLLLALANRSVRARGRWTPGGNAMPVQPLGIGADANWMWHEFGHVLLMARTGELEFRFAHSPGDALAAIVADPASDTKTRSTTASRFATFPWVFAPRRHDRCAHQGWGWSGPVHAPLARVPYSLQPRQKGYLSEQILSSSLFRLYRCLGGDTGPHGRGLAERQRASHYTLFLVMKALQWSNDATAHPVTTPENLFCDLQLADYFSTTWKARYQDVDYERVGNLAGKLIRWAFEAQGLFDPAAGDPYGPGAPPPVDVYIRSRRPTVDAVAGDPVDYGPGSYVPVPLHWQRAGQASVPAWQADPSAIRVAADGAVTVAVGNRGSVVATGVSVEVWGAEWPAGDATPPSFGDAAWQSLGVAAAPDVAVAAVVDAGPIASPGFDGRYVLLAHVTCAGDRSNIDASVTPLGAPVIDLVAGDNNTGLLVVG